MVKHTATSLLVLQVTWVFLIQLQCILKVSKNQQHHFDILASDVNKFRLLIKESLLIKRDQLQSNKTIKSFPLRYLIDKLVDKFQPYTDLLFWKY